MLLKFACFYLSALVFVTAQDFRFLVVGDTGFGSSVDWNKSAALGIAALISQEPDARFLLHTGDIAYTGELAEYQEFFSCYAPFLSRAPVFPTLGNHDYGASDAQAYRSLFGLADERIAPSDWGRYYSFDWGSVHFVALDSNQSLWLAGQGQGGMLDWLAKDLSATRQPWRIAYFHHPPHAFQSPAHKGDATPELVRTLLVPILERYRVQLVFSGHEHAYQRSLPIREGRPDHLRGIVYIATGGGGQGLYVLDYDPAVAYSNSAHHYLRVEVSESKLTVFAIGLDGAVFDTARLHLRRSVRPGPDSPR